MRNWKTLIYWLTVAAVLGGIIHICTILALPHLAEKDAWARLAALAPVNKMLVLPQATPEAQALPMMAPDIRYAACRYDLSGGALKIRAPMRNGLWSVALYTRHGANYYLITGAEVKRPEISILLNTVSDEQFDTFIEKQDEDLGEISVKAPSPRGILLVRAPMPSSGYGGLTETALQSADCAAQTVAQAK